MESPFWNFSEDKLVSVSSVGAARTLFREVVALTDAARQQIADEAEREKAAALGALVASVKSAQAALMVCMLDDLDVKVREAALSCKGSLDLRVFEGTELFHGHFYLYLLLGPRDRKARDEMRALGVVPIIEQLRRILSPFTLTHAWHPSGNTNTLRLSWIS